MNRSSELYKDTPSMLSGLIKPLIDRATIDPAPGSDTHTGKMLKALEDGEGKTSAELALISGVSSSLVGPILKFHIASGRVISDLTPNGKRIWRISQEFDQETQRKLAQAKTLLKRHGFTVTAPISKGAAA